MMSDKDYSNRLEELADWFNERDIMVPDGMNLCLSMIAWGQSHAAEAAEKDDEDFIRQLVEQLRAGIAHYRKQEQELLQ